MKHKIDASAVARMPRLLYADEQGRIYDHPDLLMLGRSGDHDIPPLSSDWMPMPEMSRLFYLPFCPPRGIDPCSGKIVTLRTQRIDGRRVRCCAVAAFLEPGYARTLLPSADMSQKNYVLPLWAYTAVGYLDNQYVVCAFAVEENPRWDPRNFDDRLVVPGVRSRLRRAGHNPLLHHLAHCATHNHCFAAKNLFLERWEAPLPVSRRCNARCLGCLSLQSKTSCPPAHHRIAFKPSVDQVVEVAVPHLEKAQDAIVSFGQGCEGEPLTEATLIACATRAIRARTARGTINLNTNGSFPGKLRTLIDSGLDSIRISMNSARPRLYEAYTRPRGFSFNDVQRSTALAREAGIFTMINYLIFPGITDQEEEFEHLVGLVNRTGIRYIHFKNLCIDPDIYIRSVPRGDSPALGIRTIVERLQEACPEVKVGYFNQPAPLS
jgi:pyruvate-formate lyase-activating enzyme